MKQPASIIAIAGLSASGKTTLAQDLAEVLNGTLIKMDDYYRDLPDHLHEAADLNWDCPQMFHLDHWRNDLTQLANGVATQTPIYDFVTSKRIRSQTISPQSVIIAEGQFSLLPEALPSIPCLKIFVDLPVDQALNRRLERDQRERGRTPESILRQWNNHVMPSWTDHVQPSSLNADVHVTGSDPRSQNIHKVKQALNHLQAQFRFLA
ncbi:MAG: AAA family ATPase [Fimbriimonadaceae bacterium]|nr:AAA family ATPase [Fimbriimonadaceae bacterium]